MLIGFSCFDWTHFELIFYIKSVPNIKAILTAIFIQTAKNKSWLHFPSLISKILFYIAN